MHCTMTPCHKPILTKRNSDLEVGTNGVPTSIQCHLNKSKNHFFRWDQRYFFSGKENLKLPQ